MKKEEILRHLQDIDECIDGFRKKYAGLGHISAKIRGIKSYIETENIIVPYQCCPKCHGTGHFNNIEQPSTLITQVCDICNGNKIIPQHVYSSL